MRIPWQRVAALACTPMLILTGCTSSTSHQVIAANAACVSCHAEEPAAYSVETPQEATESNGIVTVVTSASSIVVCKPVFTSEDGSAFVPVSYETYLVEAGETQLDLEEGIWAVCVDNGDSSTGVLVNSVASYNGEARIKL